MLFLFLLRTFDYFKNFAKGLADEDHFGSVIFYLLVGQIKANYICLSSNVIKTSPVF